MKVLYVEDDATTREYVARGLTRKGFVVDVAETLAAGRDLATGGQYDVLIFDVMLPDGEGFELLRSLRETGCQTPALYLSARGEVSDRILGFETGADDYLPKPFALQELVARVRAVSRRSGTPASDRLVLSDLEMDVDASTVSRAGQAIELTSKQFALLELLMRNAGRVQSRAHILEQVWGHDSDRRSNVVDVQVSYLRKKIDEGFASRLLHTRPGVGYVLEERESSRKDASRG